MTIEVFADILCPFTHVGLRRVVRRRDGLGHTTVIRVRAWLLEIVNGEPVTASLVVEEAQELRRQVAPDLFTGVDAATFPATSLPALALAATAYRNDDQLGEHVSLAIRTALFEEGRDISAPSVLAELGATFGLTVQPQDHEAVRDDWREGIRRHVQGSPHFFAAGHDAFCPSLDIRRVDGQLRITVDTDALEQFLDSVDP